MVAPIFFIVVNMKGYKKTKMVCHVSHSASLLLYQWNSGLWHHVISCNTTQFDNFTGQFDEDYYGRRTQFFLSMLRKF